jgi:hypothetical protein
MLVAMGNKQSLFRSMQRRYTPEIVIVDLLRNVNAQHLTGDGF